MFKYLPHIYNFMQYFPSVKGFMIFFCVTKSHYNLILSSESDCITVSLNLNYLCLMNHHLCHFSSSKLFIKINQGFPGGAVVESPPANAGDTGLSLGLGRSHMPRSSWAREPQLLSLRVWSLCSATREDTTVRGPRTAMKSGPRLLQLEKALAQKQTQHSHK